MNQDEHAKKQGSQVDTTIDVGGLQEQANEVIGKLWDNGLLRAHPHAMLHTDGLHRFDLAPSIGDDKLALAMREVLPIILTMLQGLIPKDAKVIS